VAHLGQALQDPGPYASEVGSDAGKFPRFQTMTASYASLTAKESALFAAIVEGMDQPGCGWLHELAESSRSLSAVLGSLVRKGLVDSNRDDNGAPSACYWVSLTDAGEALAVPAAPAAPSPILPGEIVAPASLAPLSPAPSLPVWQAQTQQQPQQGASAPVLNSRATFPELKSMENLYKITPANLLSVNPKTEKSLKNGDPQTYILHLAPHNLSGVNVCPGAGNCKKICLHSAGNPVYMEAKQAARIRRTLAYIQNPEAFLRVLVCSILDKIKKANGEPIAIRLNGTSDIAWENVNFNVSPEFATFCRVKYGHQLLIGRQNIFELFNSLGVNCKFYDYTKIRRDWGLCAYLGYHLTFSFDGWDNSFNLKLCRGAIASGVNVAAAFNVKRGQTLPSILESGELADFNLPIVDGDLTDYRPADPAGVIVGLRYKLPVGSPMGPIEKDLFKRAFCMA
jgi:DNA-binding MarR family transcriptional regulator